MKYLAFAIYSICYEAIVWGGFFWAHFEKGASGWWILLAIWMSMNQLKSAQFGTLTIKTGYTK